MNRNASRDLKSQISNLESQMGSWSQRAFLFLVLFSPFAMATARAAEQGSALTYEGRLSTGGTPANGTFDFQFTLWDALADGTLVAGPLSAAAVPAVNGLFTAEVDFGAAAFPGQARWMEISVRLAGSGDVHTKLTPRQPVGAVPYALHALATSGPTDANSIQSGILADERLSANIVRQADLLARLADSNAVLLAQITTVSNYARTNIPAGVTVASADAQDAALAAQGFSTLAALPAPAWSPGSTQNQPSGRYLHSTIWNGQKLMVWGGLLAAGVPLASGGSYQPDTDHWTVMSPIGAPAARSEHTAVWSGQEMIVWGGFGSTGFLGAGGRFQSALQLWNALSNTGAPSERAGHVAVWNDSRMIVWGGRNGGGLLDDGALYNPSANTWSTLAVANPPEPRHGAAAAWTGSRMLVWGGEGALGALDTGGQLLFDGVGQPLSWQAISTVNAPSPRTGHTAIWTGNRLLVWGGARGGTLLGDGGSYDPVSDVWTSLPTTDAPAARVNHVAVWSGRELIVWSGTGVAGDLGSGGAFDPVSNPWRGLSNPGTPLARTQAGAVWTGRELLVFGGRANGAAVAALQRVDPQPAWFLYRKP